MPLSDQPSGVPAGRAPSERGSDRLDLDSCAREQPRHDGVRVPHLAGPELVASPYGRRNRRREVEQTPREFGIAGQAGRAFHRLREVRYHALAPAPDLVAKDAQAASPACADRPFSNDPALVAALISHGSHLDHEALVAGSHLERRVVQRVRRPPLESRRHCLVDATVEADRVTPRAERQPVQVDAGVDRHGRAAVRAGRLESRCHISHHGTTVAARRRQRIRGIRRDRAITTAGRHDSTDAGLGRRGGNQSCAHRRAPCCACGRAGAAGSGRWRAPPGARRPR